MKRLLLILTLALIVCLVFPSVSSASIYYVWADTTLNGEKDLLLGQISGYTGGISGKNNYDYSSFSGHPINGPTPQEHKLKIFVYERPGKDKEWLNIIAGEDGTGGRHNFGMSIEIMGSDLTPFVSFGDEDNEFSETAGLFEGDWSFRNNTDGGVIGGLRGDWEAKITFLNTDLEKHVFASNGSSNIGIDGLLFDEGEIKYDTYFISYTDQVVPEPATLLLFGSGLVGAFIRRKRKA